MSQQQQPPPPRPPRISESWMPAADQRVYALAGFGLLQAYKISDLVALGLRYFTTNTAAPSPSTFLNVLYPLSYVPLLNWVLPHAESTSSAYVTKWIVLDVVAVLLVCALRIPGIAYGTKRAVLYAVVLGGLDGIIFGRINILGYMTAILAALWKYITGSAGSVKSVSERKVKLAHLLDESDYFGGHKTLKILPNGNAAFNPLQATWCIPPGNKEPIYIPIIVNQTLPSTFSYSFRPFSSTSSPPHPEETYTVSVHKLKKPKMHQIEKAIKKRRWDDPDEEEVRERRKGLVSGSGSGKGASSRLIMGAEEAVESGSLVKGSRKLAEALVGQPSLRPGNEAPPIPDLLPSQRLYLLPVKDIGVVKIINITDSDDYMFRLSGHPAIIVECPSQAAITGVGGDPVTHKAKEQTIYYNRCVGNTDTVTARMRGVGPMKMVWRTTLGDQVDDFEVDNIESGRPQQQTGVDQDESAQELILKEGGLSALEKFTPQQHISPARNHFHSVEIKHERPRIYEIGLKSVRDVFNNELPVDHTLQKRVFHIHGTPQAEFSLQAGSPLALKVGVSAVLPIVSVRPEQGYDIYAQVEYTPDEGLTNAMAKTVDVVLGEEPYRFVVHEPGTYRIVKVWSSDCDGAVSEPSSAYIPLLPHPTVVTSIDAKDTQDCAGSTGVNFHADAVGTPPFVLHYTVKKDKTSSKRKTYKFDDAHADFTEKPDEAGEYTYQVIAISDANYKIVSIDSPPVHHKIHPAAKFTANSVAFKSAETIRTCQTNMTSVGFTLSGVGPFKVERVVLWPGDSRTETFDFDKPGKKAQQIEIPEALKANGGQFSVSYIKLTDGNGCNRSLANIIAKFNVDTARPTARLGRLPEGGMYEVKEGESVRVPLLLTGSGRWTVVYKRTYPDGKETKLTSIANDANSKLSLQGAGTFELVEVSDQFCDGNIVEAEKGVEVQYIGRPSVSLVPGNNVKESKGVHILPPVCSGKEDHVILRFDGKPLFSYQYKHSYTDLFGREREPVTIKQKSPQHEATFHLTSTPGKHRYDFLRIGDFNYGLDTTERPHLHSQKPLFSVEQRVNARPTAVFKSTASLNYCLLDSFKKQDHPAQIVFGGIGPFSVSLTLLNGGNKVITKTINDIPKSLWDVDLPEVDFQRVGLYTLRIDSVRDSTGCVWDNVNDDARYVGIHVVEQASIKAVNEKMSYCVGDMLDFVLQGTKPWNVEYKFNSHTHKVHSDQPQFSRLADHAGKFEIVSVSHSKARQCSNKITGMERVIHPLPKARIESGSASIREDTSGEKIDFFFEGTPPFSFTYTRSSRKGNKLVIEETQTITNISTRKHTVDVKFEGEYDVVAVSDAFCSVSRRGVSGAGGIREGQLLLQN